MSFKEWWAGRKEKSASASPKVTEETGRKVGFQGKEVHVNPPAEVSLKRLEARLETVNKLLATKFKHGHPRYNEFMRIKNRLVLQIKLRKGDY